MISIEEWTTLLVTLQIRRDGNVKPSLSNATEMGDDLGHAVLLSYSILSLLLANCVSFEVLYNSTESDPRAARPQTSTAVAVAVDRSGGCNLSGRGPVTTTIITITARRRQR